MNAKLLRRISFLSAAAIFLLTACTSKKDDTGEPDLTWGTRTGYESFLKLADKTYPEIHLGFSTYAGTSPTSYEWAQMRGNDIPDIFVTSQVQDPELASECLADLSGFDFTDNICPAFLEDASIDGGIYLLPVSTAMHGIYYNKTLMEENRWTVPADFGELEELCSQIQDGGMTPGLVGTRFNDDSFSAVFNLAKAGWFSTPDGIQWEQDFLTGSTSAAGMWEDTMDYVQQYIDIGMYSADPKERSAQDVITEELGNRQAMFCTSMLEVSKTELPGGDQLGMMPYISEDDSNNIYIYQPVSYIGISSRLTEPGNEKKLEDALKLLSLLYSPDGQDTFINDQTLCRLSVLASATAEEDSLIYDALLAQRDGRVFPITFTRWENILYDMGKVCKRWFGGENGLDSAKCISILDELQARNLSHREITDLCECTADFTIEETAALAGKALGSSVGADAAMIPAAAFYKERELGAGISGKLYKGTVTAETASTISPGHDGEYAILTMTGAEAKELASEGFDLGGDGNPYPYILVAKGGSELKDEQTYQVAFLMQTYTRETGELYHARVEEGSFRTFLREWLREQQSVSPDGNPWK